MLTSPLTALLRIATAATALIFLTGCSAGVKTSSSGQDELVLFTDAGFLSGDEAAISGTLAVTEAGCVGITTEWGEVLLTVLPRNSEIRGSSPVAVSIPGEGVLHVGDTLTGSGGFYSADTFDALDVIETRCEWSGEIVGITP